MKKIIKEEENEEEEEIPEEVPRKDVKLGEINLRESAVLTIKKTNYMGQDRIDFRVWLNSPKYKGPTRQGFALPMEKMDEFIKIVEGMKKKLEESEK
ncbi:MAG TPA: hypothetical protein VJ343_01550 [archaeon]|nr:hypothetical protein [archaeon]